MKKVKADAVVIGSGVGGLCAAARLVDKGLKVVLAEKLPYVGGRFSSRDYKGYKITTGAIMVPYGEQSTFHQAYKLLDVPMNVRLTSGKFRLRLKHGEFETTAEGGDMAGMLQFALGDDEKAYEIAAQFMRAVLWWQPLDTITVKDWLLQFTDDENVHGQMQGFCGAFIGLNSNEVPAGELFHLMRAMLTEMSFGIAINGNLEIMEALAAGIKAKGSEVITGAPCKRIITEKERVTGIVIEQDGEEVQVDADYVISNAGPVRTVQLAGEENFEKSYMTLLTEHQYTTPVVHIAIGSKEPLADFDGIINFGNTRRLVFLETPSVTCPELAPDGMHLSSTFSVPQFAAGPLKLRETIDMVMLDLQDNFPAFRESDILMIATHHGEWPAMRRWPGYPMPIRTPVENLYNVGDGCMPRGMVGIEACAQSAKQVVEDILR